MEQVTRVTTWGSEGSSPSQRGGKDPNAAAIFPGFFQKLNNF